ncbi:MAG: hypothetical protein U0230_13065 [Polyangiales bacterium]
MRPEELLERVVDRESFVLFLRALAEEGASAEEEERAEPERYRVDGARGWKNGDLSGFLFGCLAHFDPKPLHQPGEEASWRALAEVLYAGKVVE